MNSNTNEAADAAKPPTPADMQETGSVKNSLLESAGDTLKNVSTEEPTPALRDKSKIQAGTVKVALLRPYARNAEIYQEREDRLFTENIRKNGVLTDLVVTGDGEVLGGNRRLRAAQQLGIDEVPVKVVECRSEDEKSLRVLDDNLQRVKTNAEMASEFKLRLEIEVRNAHARKVEAGRKKGETKDGGKGTPPVADQIDENGKARDKAAKSLNLSGVTADKGRKVLEAVTKARAEGNTAVADELLLLLERGFDTAFKRAKALKLILGGAQKGQGERGKGNATKRSKSGKDGDPTAAANAKQPQASVPENDDQRPVEGAEGSNAQQLQSSAPASDDQPPVVRITEWLGKALGELKHLEMEGLTNDEKENVQRAYNAIEDWMSENSAGLQPTD